MVTLYGRNGDPLKKSISQIGFIKAAIPTFAKWNYH